ncbi:putative polyol transporter 5 [Iris pallida]|uniref:Polyol transporter 5 n=1 Tax=Iris pallida TaxID=29817 RepID=A0AAX6ID09_IRIPA|nr:putative polyol transporter 5 [Iris pallida]
MPSMTCQRVSAGAWRSDVGDVAEKDAVVDVDLREGGKGPGRRRGTPRRYRRGNHEGVADPNICDEAPEHEHVVVGGEAHQEGAEKKKTVAMTLVRRRPSQLEVRLAKAEPTGSRRCGCL